MNIVIISEMRVGSRWIHYLLADLLRKSTSGEMAGNKINDFKEEIRNRFNANKIVKLHQATQYQIFRNIKPIDYKVIGIVRNPRDRLVSRTFHAKYRNPGLAFVKKQPTDLASMKALMNEEAYRLNDERQFILMPPGYSTKRYGYAENQNYIWTCYEWLIEDPYYEIKTILDFLGLHPRTSDVNRVILKHSFRSKSKRAPGEEDRTDEWRRKGVNGDWINWFDNEMVLETKEVFADYWARIMKEEGGEPKIE
jgi:hypothetical protein